MKNKTNIVLLHPPLSMIERYGDSKKFTGHIHPPQGLCHLAAMFDEKKYDVSIIDSQALFIGVEETINKIIDLNPDYIGIMTFTVTMHTIANLYKLIKEKLSNVKIILGGPHMNACAEETFIRYPFFEIAVLHEGEYTFLELIECLENNDDLNKVKGLIYKNNEGKVIFTGQRPYIKKLDELPFPRWDLLPYLPDYYRPSKMTYKKLPAVAIVTSRGCPYRCSFCDRSVFGRQWRAHSAETVLLWIDYLVNNYGIQDINFQDDHFMVNKKRLFKICEGIKEKHPNLIWSTIGRADAVDEETVAVMKDAGCWQISFGIETSSQKILDILKKDIKIEQVINAVNIIKKFDITIKGLFMAGCPLETIETLEETAKLIKELKLDYISMSAFTPTPNTDIYKEWEKYGHWEGANPDDWHKLNLWEPIFIPHGLTKDILKKYIARKEV